VIRNCALTTYHFVIARTMESIHGRPFRWPFVSISNGAMKFFKILLTHTVLDERPIGIIIGVIISLFTASIIGTNCCIVQIIRRIGSATALDEYRKFRDALWESDGVKKLINGLIET